MGRGITQFTKQLNAPENEKSIGRALMPTNELNNPGYTPTQQSVKNSLRADNGKTDKHWIQKAFSKGKPSACATESHYPRRLGVLRPLYAPCDANSELDRMVANDAQMQQAQQEMDALYGPQDQLFTSAANSATDTPERLRRRSDSWYDTVIPSSVGAALLC